MNAVKRIGAATAHSFTVLLARPSLQGHRPERCQGPAHQDALAVAQEPGVVLRPDVRVAHSQASLVAIMTTSCIMTPLRRPVGRIVNRFTSDFQSIDREVADTCR